VQVNHDLEAIVAGPLDCLVEVRRLALDVRLPAANVVGPEADGDANMVEARSWNAVSLESLVLPPPPLPQARRWTANTHQQSA
jgi:hypothetical protein